MTGLSLVLKNLFPTSLVNDTCTTFGTNLEKRDVLWIKRTKYTQLP